jgi:polyisoprenoid-binding protein YceI
VAAAQAQTDQHLRSTEFFDAGNHPTVQFVSDSVVLQGDTLSVRGWLFARDQSIPLEFDARLCRVDGELEIEAAASAPHRELGMTWNPLGMIPPRSELHVTGYLVPATEQAA